MKMIDDRLACILSHIPDGKGLIDVGTDHGYLIAELARRGYSGKLFASDVNEWPLNRAKETAKQAELSDRVEFLLCDGLALCPPGAVDCIVIAGMGGDTICGILDRAEWCMDPDYLLVLQPMTKAEVLRYWLINNGFSITEEDLVRDGKAVYAVVCARFGGSCRLTDAECCVGSGAMLREHPLFPEWLARHQKRYREALAGLRLSVGREDGRAALYEGILSQLKEMANDKGSTDI